MSDEVTTEQWEDRWWETWRDAKRTMSGEQAAGHAERETVEQLGERPEPVEPARATGGVISSQPAILGEHGCSLPAPITVDDVARLYDVPRELLDTSLEPAPPSQRGWLRRALDRLVR